MVKLKKKPWVRIGECTCNFDAARWSRIASIGCMMDGRTLLCPFDVEMGLLDDLSPLELKASKLGQS
jgi:hypothetical protein